MWSPVGRVDVEHYRRTCRRKGCRLRECLDRLASDTDLGLTRADLDALLSEPITFTGAARDQVEAVVRRAVHLTAAEPDAAAYDPGAIL